MMSPATPAANKARSVGSGTVEAGLASAGWAEAEGPAIAMKTAINAIASPARAIQSPRYRNPKNDLTVVNHG
jgi:hypothetical protein